MDILTPLLYAFLFTWAFLVIMRMMLFILFRPESDKRSLPYMFVVSVAFGALWFVMLPISFLSRERSDTPDV